MTATLKAESAIERIREAAYAVAAAMRVVQELEDERPLIKAKSIAEMVGTPNPLGKPGAVHSASSAEAIVEENARYWRHRKLQADAEVAKWCALGEWEAAKLSAQLAVACTEV